MQHFSTIIKKLVNSTVERLVKEYWKRHPGGKIKKKISLNFTILSRDELPFSLPSSLISCKLTSTDLGKHMRCDVKQTAEGKYSITFTPFSRNHNLTVQVGGIRSPW